MASTQQARGPSISGDRLPAFRFPRWAGVLLAPSAGLALLALTVWIPWRNLTSPLAAQTVTIAVGRTLGLLAAMLLMLQFTMSARLKFLDRAFALDRLLRFHALTGAAAGVLAACHPLLLLSTDVYELRAFNAAQWPVLLGVASLVLLTVILCTSLWRAFLAIPFHTWRILHLLTFVAVATVSVHALSIGGDLRKGWPFYFWIAVLVLYVALFVRTKIVMPILLHRRRYVVDAIEKVSPNTWNLDLSRRPIPPLRHFPGQFAFLRPYHEGLRRERHPFTISSSSTGDPATISFTIKESGDFTRHIGEIQLGDLVSIDGPYGRFSFLLKRVKAGDHLLMIAGGVGITPILSMLRFMRDIADPRPVTLIWANRARNDIFFREEIDSLPRKLPNLRVHHVLSDEPDWPGPRGYVTEALLQNLLTEGDRRARVFLCGPPPMMESVAAALRKLGFPRRRIHTERFSF